MPPLRIAVAAALLAALSPAQDGATRRHTTTVFAIDLPAEWRELGPEEADRLREQLPYMLRAVHTSIPHGTALQVFGAVDRWLESGFDGRALQIVSTSGGPAVDEELVETLREHYTAFDAEGVRREVLEAHLSTVGKDAHPCAELRIRTVEPGFPPTRQLEFSTSTGARWLNLSFHAWEDDWDEAEAGIRALASSLTFPHPPRDPEVLGDRLLEAAVVGGLVGVLLLTLRKLRG